VHNSFVPSNPQLFKRKNMKSNQGSGESQQLQQLFYHPMFSWHHKKPTFLVGFYFYFIGNKSNIFLKDSG